MIDLVRWAVTASATALLAGCGPTTEEIVERERAVIISGADGIAARQDALVAKMLLSLTRDQLKDPDSARFQNLRVAGTFDKKGKNSGGVLCGEVNAKNSMGGYVGLKPFYTLLIGYEVTFHVINDEREAEVFGSSHRSMCEGTRPVAAP